MVLAAVFAGILVGVITGLTPGLHVNLVSVLLLSVFPLLPLSPQAAAAFIIAIAITHTFLDIIPSVFLGAPDDAMALGVLPAHRYLLKGYGLMAVKLSTIGAFCGLLLGLASYWVFIRIAIWFEAVPKWLLGVVLLLIPLYMFLRDKHRIAAAIIIIYASLYGFLGFQFPNPLFPMLSGLFGAATLLYSLWENSSLPQQKDLPFTAMRIQAWRALLGGLVAGGLTAVLPGLGAAHASVFGMLLAGGTGDHGYLLMSGVIGTTNFFLSLAAYHGVEKARNGALLTATTIEPQVSVQLAIGIALLAGGIGVLLSLLLGRHIVRVITKLPYQTISIAILLFVSILVFILNGWSGVLVYGTGALIGLLPAFSKAARAHAMSCLLVPVGIRFLLG